MTYHWHACGQRVEDQARQAHQDHDHPQGPLAHILDVLEDMFGTWDDRRHGADGGGVGRQRCAAGLVAGHGDIDHLDSGGGSRWEILNYVCFLFTTEVAGRKIYAERGMAVDLTPHEGVSQPRQPSYISCFAMTPQRARAPLQQQQQ